VTEYGSVGVQLVLIILENILAYYVHFYVNIFVPFWIHVLASSGLLDVLNPGDTTFHIYDFAVSVVIGYNETVALISV